MKKYFSFLLILLSLFLVSCTEKEKGLKYEKIDAEHLISDESISSYLVLRSRLMDDDMYHSLTIYSNFLKGTGRYYHYYQVDYLTNSGDIEQYYHLFNITDNDERKYSQNFLPYYKFSGVKEFDVLFEYEYIINEEKIVNQIKYHEEVLTIDESKENYSDKLEDVDIKYSELLKDERKYYNINIDFKDLNSGHIDLQSWILTSDGKLYPFLGIYHYQLDRGNYDSIGYEEIDKNIEIVKIYFKINHYYDEKVDSYLYQIKNN